MQRGLPFFGGGVDDAADFDYDGRASDAVKSCGILKAGQEDVIKIYQAAPLFSEAENTWHRSFTKMLAAAGHDVVTAILDVSQADDGSAWEIGYAYARKKPVVGIRTGFRNASDTDHGMVNAMSE